MGGLALLFFWFWFVVGIFDFLWGYYCIISSFACFSALLSAVVGWAEIVRGLRGVLAMGESMMWVLARIARVSLGSPESYPCLSSMSIQVEVGCISSFPQLVEHIDEGV